jgi:glycosyltransferase involved in cell wall biosynthesis
MNWIHRRLRTGARHFLRAELNNWLLRLIRNRMADHIVYQSRFARGWWERVGGPLPAPASVVYNGVPLGTYTPDGPDERPSDRWRLLVVEGNLAGGYEVGLEAAVGLVRRLQEVAGRPVELVVAGRVPERDRRRWTSDGHLELHWLGLIPPTDIPALNRSAHLLYSADLNSACPNAVVEAMACGLPVVAFDTGALPELVKADAGRLASYGGDPWRLDPPHLEALSKVAMDVLREQPRFRAGARRRAEEAFGLERMVDGYLAALGWM